MCQRHRAKCDVQYCLLPKEVDLLVGSGPGTKVRAARSIEVWGDVNMSQGNMNNVNRPLVTKQKLGRSKAEVAHHFQPLKIEPCQYPSR